MPRRAFARAERAFVTAAAVDSPGSPGLDFAELARLIRFLIDGGRIAGAGVAIYDPELDPTGRHARGIVACRVSTFGGSR